jgi:hypothetical protein
MPLNLSLPESERKDIGMIPTAEQIKAMSERDICDLLTDQDAPLNRLRQLFSSEAARIEQAIRWPTRSSVSPVEYRRMEFLAVLKIIDEMRRLTRPTHHIAAP